MIAVLDANLAVLLAVGRTDRALLGRHKRVNPFDGADFDLLVAIIGRASKVLFTPNVVTETSNLSRQIAEPHRTRVARVLRAMLHSADEVYMPSRSVTGHPEYEALGVTDAGLLALLGPEMTLYTADLDLWAAGRRLGLRVVNFNHVRQMSPPGR